MTLYEASDRLGGLLKTADYDENKRELKRYKDYLVRQVEKSDITVHTSVKATPELIRQEAPDYLALAMGSVPVTPPIPGAELAIQATEAHEHMDQIGKQVVFIGGGLVGSEFALTLAMRGHKVSIIEITGTIGGQKNAGLEKAYEMLESTKNITLLPYTQCTEIRDGSVLAEDRDGFKMEIPADTVILSAGFVSNREGLDGFYGITPHTVMIGDLRRPATVRECEEEGYFAFSET